MPGPAETRNHVLYLGRLALLFAIYVGTAKLGLYLDAVGGFATFVWPPTGISLAALLVFGKRQWPAIAAGALVANVTAGAPVAVACGIAAGNALEAVAAAMLLERLQFDRSFGRIRDVLLFVGTAAIGSTLISATVGVASLWIGGVVHASDLVATGRAWWIGDGLGDLVVAPFLLVWWCTPKQATAARVAEVMALLAITVGASLYVFGVISPMPPSNEFRWPYLVFPMLIWGSLRFGQLGATGGTLVVWIVSIVTATLGVGVAASGRLSESLLPLQLFMSVVALTMLFLGAAVRERDHAASVRASIAIENAKLFDEAQQAIRARDEFLAVASHELRTPLTTLHLSVSNLRMLVERGPVATEKLLAKLDVVGRQGDRLNALVESLLDVTRVMAGRLQLADEPVDLGEVVRELAVRFRDQAAKAGCDLVVELEDMPPIQTDRLRVEQIVTNLLGNAIKFGNGKAIQISLSTTPTSIVLTVRDQGTGIAPADHRRIFERFERTEPHLKAGGLGLGLWIVRQIVLAMHGDITVASELGSGAQFTVTLPKSQNRAAQS